METKYESKTGKASYREAISRDNGESIRWKMDIAEVLDGACLLNGDA
jgi:hypothetical protein